jgi:hypothetical protein
MTQANKSGLTAYRISWTESETGWGQRPDGYSLHISFTEASRYLKKTYDVLPEQTPDEYEFPSRGWREPVRAFPVEIAPDSLIAHELKQKTSIRVYRSFNGLAGELYREASALTPSGCPVLLDCVNTPAA